MGFVERIMDMFQAANDPPLGTLGTLNQARDFDSMVVARSIVPDANQVRMMLDVAAMAHLLSRDDVDRMMAALDGRNITLTPADAKKVEELVVATPPPAPPKVVIPESGERFAATKTITLLDGTKKEVEIPDWLTRASGFKFGAKSKAELAGVHPVLIAVFELALSVSTQDWMLYDGLRTEAEQRSYVNRGVSKTMASKHRRQDDGFSHAGDAVPVVKTLPKWDWNLIFPVVAAVDWAATQLGVADKIRWGGAWDRTLADFGGNPKAYAREIELYASRHPGKDFLDGPHFEIVTGAKLPEVVKPANT